MNKNLIIAIILIAIVIMIVAIAIGLIDISELLTIMSDVNTGGPPGAPPAPCNNC